MRSINYSKAKKVLWLILFANLAVAALKIIFGYVINSNSLTADGFHSLTDGSSNIAGLIGMHFASKPVDKDHPYGHSKFETLAGLFIAIMLFILGTRIISTAIINIVHPNVPAISIVSLTALLSTLAVNILIARYEYKNGKALNSPILISDSLHTQSDIFISAGVLFTLLCIRLGMPPIVDSVASLIVSAFVFHAAYEIFSENSGVLVDKAAVEPEQIASIVLCFSQVKNVHKIRSRGCHHSIYIDLHILVEPHMSIESSHTLMHEIELSLAKALEKPVQANIHLEPFYKMQQLYKL